MTQTNLTPTPRGERATYKCQRCRVDFTARVADRKRGWARFCSKSCKAIIQEKTTGQYAALCDRRDSDETYDRDMDAAGGLMYSGFFGHGQE